MLALFNVSNSEINLKNPGSWIEWGLNEIKSSNETKTIISVVMSEYIAPIILVEKEK